MDDQLSSHIEDLKTNEDDLEQTLNDYDLDEELETEFDAIDAEFRELEIIYQSLLNTRRFLNNAT
jgi:hypothetical protein